MKHYINLSLLAATVTSVMAADTPDLNSGSVSPPLLARKEARLNSDAATTAKLSVGQAEVSNFIGKLELNGIFMPMTDAEVQQALKIKSIYESLVSALNTIPVVLRDTYVGMFRNIPGILMSSDIVSLVAGSEKKEELKAVQRQNNDDSLVEFSVPHHSGAKYDGARYADLPDRKDVFNFLGAQFDVVGILESEGSQGQALGTNFTPAAMPTYKLYKLPSLLIALLERQPISISLFLPKYISDLGLQPLTIQDVSSELDRQRLNLPQGISYKAANDALNIMKEPLLLRTRFHNKLETKKANNKVLRQNFDDAITQINPNYVKPGKKTKIVKPGNAERVSLELPVTRKRTASAGKKDAPGIQKKSAMISSPKASSSNDRD